jgi:hypothetical protein
MASLTTSTARRIVRPDFHAAMEGRRLDIAKLPADVAAIAREADVNGDGVIESAPEMDALFDRIAAMEHAGAQTLRRRRSSGTLTEAGRTFNALALRLEGNAAHGINSRDDFFNAGLLDVHIDHIDPSKTSVAALRDEHHAEAGELRIYKATDRAHRLWPGQGEEKNLVARATNLKLRTSGNLTNGTPKSSYKLEIADAAAKVFGMKTLNLKSKWNDVSQMREDLFWKLAKKAGLKAPRLVHMRVAINDQYKGLYAGIEQVDKAFLKDRFGKNDKGNLYKAYQMTAPDVGGASLEHRVARNGKDDGRAYFNRANIDERDYQLKTNDDDPKKSTYDDLATFVRTLHARDIPGGFESDDYRKAMEDICDVKQVLRWAALNVLTGAWDNYWTTSANYYLYNGGKKDDAEGFMERPYFTLIPWDYDNTFGIDYFRKDWAQASLVDWSKTTRRPDGKPNPIPLVDNLLKNPSFRAYYLDHVEKLLDDGFNVADIEKSIGDEGKNGIWDNVRAASYEEADGPTTPPHTGRQFTNDQVYWNGFRGFALWNGQQYTPGIIDFVRAREKSARDELRALRSGS